MDRRSLADQLCQLIRNEDAAVLSAALNKGARSAINSANRMGDRPLICAAEVGKIESAMVLLEHGADINGTDRTKATPLTNAVCYGHGDMVPILLGVKGVDVNGQDYERMTALHWALRLDDKASAEALLAAPAIDCQSRAKGGLTPLHVAAQEGLAECIGSIIARGGLTNATDSDGRTPLFLALASPKCVAELLTNGADTKVVDDFGDSILHAAAAGDFVESARLLLESGANPDAVNAQGNSPLDIAQHRGFAALSALIESFGGHAIKPVNPETKPTRRKRKSDREKKSKSKHKDQGQDAAVDGNASADGRAKESDAAVAGENGKGAKHQRRIPPELAMQIMAWWRIAIAFSICTAWFIRLLLRILEAQAAAAPQHTMHSAAAPG